MEYGTVGYVFVSTVRFRIGTVRLGICTVRFETGMIRFGIGIIRFGFVDKFEESVYSKKGITIAQLNKEDESFVIK